MNGVYSIQGSQLKHGYGGDVKVETIDDRVSIYYKDIPKGKPCFWFYFMNIPLTYFSDVTVDGKPTERGSSNQEIEKLKNELCYSSNDKVEIVYAADVTYIRNKYKLFNP